MYLSAVLGSYNYNLDMYTDGQLVFNHSDIVIPYYHCGNTTTVGRSTVNSGYTIPRYGVRNVFAYCV